MSTAGHTSTLPSRLTRWPREIPWSIRAYTFAAAAVTLIWLDVCSLFGFRSVCRAVQHVRLSQRPVKFDALMLVRLAVRDACVVYFKPVLCLQRSAAVTRLLRRRGIDARLVIGYQSMPVQWHAWVELDGRVVWDGVSSLAHFHQVDRL